MFDPQVAIDESFAAFGQDAYFAPSDGAAKIACRIIINAADDITIIGAKSLIQPSRLIEVRQSEICDRPLQNASCFV